jgi:DNA topoisomerase-3
MIFKQAQGEAICACGNTAVQRTSKKENENKGRQFYTCADGSCNAFSWADSVGEDTGGGENWGGGGGGGYNKGGGYQKKKSYSNKSFGTGASSGGHKKGKYGGNNNSSSAAPKVQRKCGVCGQPGHNKKNCPNS